MFDNPDIVGAILLGIAAVVPFLWKLAKTKWTWLQKQLEKTELDELAEGVVAEVYQEFVRDIKAKSDDGKLTSEEKKEAMDKAIAKFRELAKNSMWPAAKALAEPVLKSLLEKAINRMKGSAKEAESK
jgi:hypothetical protein